MTNRSYMHYRWIRKLALLMAAAPLFQLSQCQTFSQQVWANVANNLPSTAFGFLQSYLLLPLQLLFGGSSFGTTP